MKAVVVRKGGLPDVLKVEELPTPQPEPGKARVHLKAAALNHRDVWQRRAYVGPGPMILGSDGAGVVAAVGDPKDTRWVGRDVVIYPSLNWGTRQEAPGPAFQILGNPTPGTYADQIVIPVENLAHKPAHLSFGQAAAIPLAGLTAWRALFTQGRLRPGQTVLLPGIGSGVAGLALVFAKRSGARVVVTTGSADKMQRALALGADAAFNYSRPDWEQQVREHCGTDGIDLVLDHSGAETLPAALRLVRPGGRIVFFGTTTGNLFQLPLRDAFFKQVHLIGTTMGSPAEFEAMLRFVELQRYVPEIHHVFPLVHAAQAHGLMERGGQFGKIVLEG